MEDLRWALLVLGAVFVAALGFWELRRSRRRDAASRATPVEPAAPIDPPRLSVESTGQRREPRIADFVPDGDPPVITARREVVDLSDENDPLLQPPRHAGAARTEPAFDTDAPPAVDNASADAEEDVVGASAPHTAAVPPPPPPPASVKVAIAAERAVDVPGATTVIAEDPRPIRWPPEELPERVLGLRVIATQGVLAGKAVRQALLAAGLRHGPQQIFHKTDMDGNVVASVANLVRPGSLVPDQMDVQEFRGLSLFAVIPGPRPAAQMLEGLVQLARSLAGRLGGIVQDEHGQDLDAERLTQLRRTVASFEEHGDGATP